MVSSEQAVTEKRIKVEGRIRKAVSKKNTPNVILTNAYQEFERYLAATDMNLKGLARLDSIEYEVDTLLTSCPDHAEALNLLSRISLERGNTKKAEEILRRALKSTPDSPSNNFTLGQIYIGKRQYMKAIQHLTTALEKAPNTDQVVGSIAFAHLKNGNTIEAYIMYRRLCFKGDTQYNAHLVECLIRAEVHNYSKQMELDLIRVLEFDEVDFNKLSGVVATLLIEKYSLRKKNNVVELMDIVNDELLRRCLQKMTISDVTIEKFISLVRASLLKECVDLDRIPEQLLDLIYSIGTYGNTNEYVFSLLDSEDKMIQYLVATIAVIIKVGKPIDKIIGGLALLSMYMPVDEVCDLIHIDLEEFEGWHATGDKLRLKCITDSKEERKYLALLNVSDQNDLSLHSSKMQLQYEENPYPRWASFSKVAPNDYIRALKTELPELCRVLDTNPSSSMNVDSSLSATCSLAVNRNPRDLLVAGCGTGRHAVQLASVYPNLDVEAIDISRRSLAYGMRKAEEFSISNLHFSYQNLLGLIHCKRQYDAIECSGVLHHLDNPEEGLNALLSTLKQDGILKLGLYSARARKHVLVTKSLIAQSGLNDATLHQIRKARTEITSGRWGSSASQVSLSPDFFTASGCRDLLFHFHEVNYTPVMLRQLLDNAGLHFLGFVHLTNATKKEYLQRFPEDKNLISLENWELFEVDNPYLFTGMYQFYCSRKR